MSVTMDFIAGDLKNSWKFVYISAYFGLYLTVNFRFLLLIKLIFSYSTDDAIWQPLAEKLTKLVSVTLIGHKWSETEALMRAIGQRLKRIYLALRGFIPNLEDNLAQPPPASTVPKLEQLLDLCPQLEDLTISFGPLTLNVSDEALLGNVQLFF